MANKWACSIDLDYNAINCIPDRRENAMKNPFTEPIAPRYIYLNPETNTLHVVLPVVSGSQIGLDNTCKSVYGLQEFFGKSRDVNQRALLDELQAYENALEFDLSLIAEDSDVKPKKRERLVQIKTYRAALEKILSSNLLDSLNKAFPEYPEPIQELMRKENSNLYSMVLRPKELDGFIRSVNPVFRLKRKEGISIFYETLSEVYNGVNGAKGIRARLIASVEASLAGNVMNFSELQRVLKEQTQSQLHATIDYSHDKAGTLITKESIDTLMGFDEADASSAKNYIAPLLGICAPELFDALVESPFFTIETAEELSIVTQFFLGCLNIYCRVHRLSSLNFGEVLDSSEELSRLIADKVLSLRESEGHIEDELLVFFNEHSESFALKNPIAPADRAQIKKQFMEQYTQIKTAPHFDEFTVLDSTTPGPFLIHQGSIGLNFAEFVEAGFPELNPDFFAAVRDDFKTCQRAITHTNPSVHTSIKLNVKTLISRIKDEDQLNLVLERLPKEQQDELLASPRIKKMQLPKMLHQVARGQQNEAEQLLKDNADASLLLHSGEFTDYSGRTFNCSAYEYAYWAKDTHMCRMLERFMDEDIKAHMLIRCEAIEAHGLTYIQNGQKVTSKHFDFTSLKTALQAYIQSHNDWNRMHNWDAMTAAWMVVGKAQRDVPAHVAQEYCRLDRSFDPLPTFDEAAFPRTLTFFNWDTEVDELWFPLALSDSSGLGVDFAVTRGVPMERWGDRAKAGHRVEGLRALVDFEAVIHLDAVRSADLTLSRENLMPVAGAHALGMSY